MKVSKTPRVDYSKLAINSALTEVLNGVVRNPVTEKADPINLKQLQERGLKLRPMLKEIELRSRTVIEQEMTQ